jgi:hypothetical protein
MQEKVGGPQPVTMKYITTASIQQIKEALTMKFIARAIAAEGITPPFILYPL